jgi:4-diphosphocytidyl-2-C-methyl-D-erythritol kinase
LYQSVENALFELSVFSEARLTGTGACVFAEFDCEAKAREAYRALQNNWQVYLAKGINKSPLLTMLEKF